MAAPTCSVSSFTTSGACYKNFSLEDRKSILIYFNSLELAAIGGTSYTLGGGGTLMPAATCYLNLLVESQTPPIPYLVMAYNNAVNAGAAPATPGSGLEAAIACNSDFSPAQKAAQLILLTCQLGSHKAYPQ